MHRKQADIQTEARGRSMCVLKKWERVIKPEEIQDNGYNRQYILYINAAEFQH